MYNTKIWEHLFNSIHNHACIFISTAANKIPKYHAFIATPCLDQCLFILLFPSVEHPFRLIKSSEPENRIRGSLLNHVFATTPPIAGSTPHGGLDLG